MRIMIQVKAKINDKKVKLNFFLQILCVDQKAPVSQLMSKKC